MDLLADYDDDSEGDAVSEAGSEKGCGERGGNRTKKDENSANNGENVAKNVKDVKITGENMKKVGENKKTSSGNMKKTKTINGENGTKTMEESSGGTTGDVMVTPSLPSVEAAPLVNTTSLEGMRLKKQKIYGENQIVLNCNPKLEEINQPLMGPLMPHETSLELKRVNHLTGQVDPYFLNPVNFDLQYYAFAQAGRALDPSDVISSEKGKRKGGLGGLAVAPVEVREKRSKGEEIGPNSAEKSAKNVENDGKTGEKDIEKKDEQMVPKQDELGKEDSDIKCNMHVKTRTDYQGKSWIDRPKDYKPRDEEKLCYLPKTHIHTFTGHQMGVHAVRFFPDSGHLLLSAGLDSFIKVWDVYNQRRCICTYTGHEQGVRDIQFTSDGRRFYSCSYDKKILLYDTEYGRVIGTYSNDKIPYCVSVHPDSSQQNVFIIGSSNKKAVQFDANSGQIVQEYSEHLKSVNTVTFIDQGRKIVTTSDDKKAFVWDYGIPVVVKHISEPSMHSMPSVAIHPSEQYVAYQSMDNQIVVYEVNRGKFKFCSRKRYRGHINSGYAIHPNFSPDGRYIVSGDAGGKLWCWDWQNGKNIRTLQAHKGVCIDAVFHPLSSSRMVTCGWDGLIKLWD